MTFQEKPRNHHAMDQQLNAHTKQTLLHRKQKKP